MLQFSSHVRALRIKNLFGSLIKQETTSLVGLLPSMLRRLRAIQRKDSQRWGDKCSSNSERKEGGVFSKSQFKEEPKGSVIVSQTSPLWPVVLLS
jgi:hypothetical protein